LEVSIGKPLLNVKEILPQNVVLDTGAMLPGELFIIAMHKGFKIILYTMVIIRILRAAWPVNGGWQ
jgi:hypothetical protein